MQKQCLDRVLIFFCLESNYIAGEDDQLLSSTPSDTIHITQGSVFLCTYFYYSLIWEKNYTQVVHRWPSLLYYNIFLSSQQEARSPNHSTTRRTRNDLVILQDHFEFSANYRIRAIDRQSPLLIRAPL